MKKFKEFMKENYLAIIFGVILIGLVCGGYCLLDRYFDLYERAIEHAIESNTSIIIK